MSAHPTFAEWQAQHDQHPTVSSTSGAGHQASSMDLPPPRLPPAQAPPPAASASAGGRTDPRLAPSQPPPPPPPPQRVINQNKPGTGAARIMSADEVQKELNSYVLFFIFIFFNQIVSKL